MQQRRPRSPSEGATYPDTKGCGRYNTVVLLLLVTILYHSIMFSSKSIDDYQKELGDVTDYAAQMLRSSNSQQREKQEQLPHWRIGTDCSPYSLDCFAVARRENRYKPYPFSLSVRKETEIREDSENTIAEQSDEWPMEVIKELPGEWIEFLEKEDNNKMPVQERSFLYPPSVSNAEYESCIDLAIKQNKPTVEQIDVLLSGNSPRILPEPDTNMVAFTISDYSYTQDMIHDVFQMMDDIVGFSNKHFFLVAIDEKTVELACKYGYSVVLWKADDNVRDAVANTKMILSYEFVKRGINFFFSEMDVWWIRSPKPNLVDFRKKHEVDGGDQRKKHLYFSAHQNNFMAPNIGVYAAMANKYTEEYFRVCLALLREKPETHDQYVMQQVDNLFQARFQGREYKFGNGFKPEGPLEPPEIKFPFESMMFSPHEIVGDERPTTTQITLAIHTLNSTPLQAPHGKKMNAKELGVYYGFHSHPNGISDGNIDSAGYYDRSGENRRYLWLDSDLRNNFYSISNSNHYHNKETLEWTMAILIAIARKTNRILILPQVFDADMDAGTYCAWTMMDYSKVADMVEFREANFLSNPKAWRNGGGVGPEYWPFESVVNTGLFQGLDNGKTAMIYTQVLDRSTIVSTKVWKANFKDIGWMDAWVGSLSAVPEFDSAEVLMVNPDAFMSDGRGSHLAWRLKHRQKKIEELGKDHEDIPRIGLMEQEVLEIYDLLGWCWNIAFRHTANKVSASDSCYGIGTPRHY